MDANPPSIPSARADPPPTVLRRAWHGARGRIIGGFMLALPVLLTFWAVFWLYSVLARYVIDPLARLVLWSVSRSQPAAPLPAWFEDYVAPLIAIFGALLLLYVLGFFVHSRLRRALDWALLRVPLISVVYNGVRKVFQALDRKPAQQRPQRVVLIEFPHPGTKVPAIVTATCRDAETQKVILCVYVPTTPMPTSGYFLLVPEENVTELNWTLDETLQTIISAGLTAPPEVRYLAWFKSG